MLLEKNTTKMHFISTDNCKNIQSNCATKPTFLENLCTNVSSNKKYQYLTEQCSSGRKLFQQNLSQIPETDVMR